MFTDTRFNTQKATSMRDPSQSEQYWQWVAFIERTKQPLFFGEWEFYGMTLDCIEKTGIALNHEVQDRDQQLLKMRRIKQRSYGDGYVRGDHFKIINSNKAQQAWQIKDGLSAFWAALLPKIEGLIQEGSKHPKPYVSDLEDVVRMIVHNDVRLLRDWQALQDYEKEMHEKLASIVETLATEKLDIALHKLVIGIKHLMNVCSCRYYF